MAPKVCKRPAAVTTEDTSIHDLLHGESVRKRPAAITAAAADALERSRSRDAMLPLAVARSRDSPIDVSLATGKGKHTGGPNAV